MQSSSGHPFSSSLIAPGTMLAGKYRVEKVIGEGGMGLVLAAHHVQLEQRVALKVLRLQVAERPDVVERFLREARNAVRLRSQHVARVLDVGTLESGVPYIVLEYLEGADFDSIVRLHGALPYGRAIALVLQACEALAEAHALGIVHRDIKPHNLFLTTGVGGADLVKVLDFGIAKSINSFGGGVLTRTDSSVGSPLYMSPEQMRSPRDVDLRTDIWSMGVTLYEMIAGRPPFDAESFPELVLKVQEAQVVPLSVVRPDVPTALSEVIGRCLRRDPRDRFEDVGALATALEPFTWPEARSSAENARRALGQPTSKPSASTPVSPASGGSAPWPQGGGGDTQLADASHSSARSQNTTGPIVASGANSANSGPKAWSESVSSHVTSAPPSPFRRRRGLALGVAAVAVIGLIVLAALGYLKRPSETSVAPAASDVSGAAASPTATQSAGATVASVSNVALASASASASASESASSSPVQTPPVA